MDQILEQLGKVFGPKAIGAYLAAQLPKLVVAIVVLAVFYLIWRFLRAGLGFVLTRAKLDQTLQEFLKTIVQYAIFAIALITALSQLGIDTTSVVTSLGVVGLTLGFAARDTLSNVISGLFIFWDRPFVIGDLVEIAGSYGRVDSITLRSTRVVTPDGKMLAIPNTNVVGSTVASYTNFPRLRLDVEVTVAVTENLGNVRRILLDMFSGDERFSSEPAPEVVAKTLNDYNVLLEVRVWIENEREHIKRRFELREMIFETLTREGVEMPFQTFALSPVDVRMAANGR